MITYNPSCRLFKLTAKTTSYAFRVTEMGDLEHLYFGPKLDNDDDLDYLTRTNNAQPFDPVVELPANLTSPKLRPVLFAEDQNMSELPMLDSDKVFDKWKSYRGSLGPYSERNLEGGGKADVASSVQKRRLENLSWRLLHMNQQKGRQAGEDEDEAKEGKEEKISHLHHDLHTLGQLGHRGEESGDSGHKNANAMSAADQNGEHAHNSRNTNGKMTEQEICERARPFSEESMKLLSSNRKVNPKVKQEEGTEIDHIEYSRKIRALLKKGASVKNIRASTSQSNLEPDGIPFAGLRRSSTKSSLDELDSMSTTKQLLNLVDEHGQSPIDQSTAMQIARMATAPPHGEEVKSFGKNTTCREYGDSGTGDFRSPSIRVTFTKEGSSHSDLKYVKHDIFPGKPDHGVPDMMPRVRTGQDCGDADINGTNAATTLVVTQMDHQNGLQVELVYVVFVDYDAIIRRVVVTNVAPTGDILFLEKVMSATIDFEVLITRYWLTSLSGSWARERYPVKRELDHGLSSFGSSRGTSSHQHNPFAVLSQGPPDEDANGSYTYALSLMYSGNFVCEAEVSDIGRLRVNMGLGIENFRWCLKSGESFCSPECLCIFSLEGVGGISRTMHQIVRDRIIPRRFRDVPCPVLVNSWEAEYFDVSHDSIVAMAAVAGKMGIELIVLDDGWFGRRNNAKTSLGDWWASKEKFPFGMKALANAVNGEGVAFGLWIEPEMISIDSDLYRKHPDWCLHVPGRRMSQGRNQLVLDISRREVRNYVYEMLAKILSTANITYVKWDMNRHLTEVFSVQLPPERQGEVSHRYVLGMYELHRKFTESFPHIRFEGCSGGGGRFDLGMLYYVPQIWCSDNTDALARIKIQHGTSWAYPAMTVGSHVSVCPNHITQGTTRKRTRALVAMCGTYGYELDLRAFDEEEIATQMNNVRVHKMIRHVVIEGDLYRLWDPFETTFAAWMYVLPNKEEAVVFAFNLTSNFWSNLVPRLNLKGLKSDGVYNVTEPLPNNRTKLPANLQVVKTQEAVYQLGAKNVRLHGRTLEAGGLPCKFFTQDDSLMFYLTLVNE